MTMIEYFNINIESNTYVTHTLSLIYIYMTNFIISHFNSNIEICVHIFSLISTSFNCNKVTAPIPRNDLDLDLDLDLDFNLDYCIYCTTLIFE